MRIIVTGSTSFIGAAAADCLKQRGHETVCLRHSFDEEPDKLPDRADVWLHFAWAGSGSADRADPKIQQYNTDMTMAALQKAEELGCTRFVFAGSQAEYGHQQDGGLKQEYGPLQPVSEYGIAKDRVRRLAEQYLAESSSGLSYVHLRIFSVYGPGDHPYSLISSLIKGFERGETVELGNCTQLWNYMYITDAAGAIGLICEQAEAGIYNVASGDTRPLRDYVLELHRLMGERGEAAFGKRPDNAEGPADLSPDVSRLWSLGFRDSISFAEGISRLTDI